MLDQMKALAREKKRSLDRLRFYSGNCLFSDNFDVLFYGLYCLDLIHAAQSIGKFAVNGLYLLNKEV